MGKEYSCKRYKKVKTVRGRELRCVDFSGGRGKAMCYSKLKGARSPGLIHPENCKAGWFTVAKKRKSKR